jgi:hypothetical protein
MGKRTLYIALITLAVVAVALLAWWWLRGRVETQQTTGTFGSAQNSSSTPSAAVARPTNVGTPIPGTTGAGVGAKPRTITIPTGTYTIGAPNAPQPLGTYTITPLDAGGYTVTPLDGGEALLPGEYIVTGDDGVIYDVIIVPGAEPGVYDIGSVPDPTPTNTGTIGVDDVVWLSNSTSTAPDSTRPAITGTGAGTVFNPTGINNLVNPIPTGGVLPNLGGGPSGISSGGGGLGLGGALAGGALAAGLSCGAAQAFQSAGIAAGAVTGAGYGAGVTAAGALVEAARTPIGVQSIDMGPIVAQGSAVVALNTFLGAISGGDNASFTTNTFFSCIARTIAKITLRQITNSVVNWINSGFSGNPAFVTNPSQFFTNIADVAAGEFIRGSSLSFLCSPFQLQIKIAIARSYARSRAAPACTLTGVMGNVNNFMNGSFSAGGWPGFLSFTSIPTNNPYGAMIFADVGITYSTQTRVGNERRQQSLAGGFLDFKQKKNCVPSPVRVDATADRSVRSIGDNPEAPASYEVCDLVTTTPGAVIENALIDTNDSSLRELELAKSFDEIINALIAQLITRTLQGGLLNLSGQGGYASNFYTPEQQQAQTAAQTLLNQLQGDSQNAQNYGGVQQGSIVDIQNAQSQLHDLYNCWLDVNQSSKAEVASTTKATLEKRIDVYNDQITRANSVVTFLVELQSEALSAGSLEDIASVRSRHQDARNSGNLLSQADIVNAQQDRTTLQNQMLVLNQQTSAQRQECNATPR